MSVVTVIEAQIEAARVEQKTACPPEAAREFALAITHLEDAVMRFNRGMAMKGGVFYQADVEALLDAEEKEALRQETAFLDQPLPGLNPELEIPTSIPSQTSLNDTWSPLRSQTSDPDESLGSA